MNEKINQWIRQHNTLAALITVGVVFILFPTLILLGVHFILVSIQGPGQNEFYQPSPAPTPVVSMVASPTPVRATPRPSPNPEISQEKPILISHVVEHPLIAAVNIYRASYGLPPVESEVYTCAAAQTRIGEIKTDWSHAQFYTLPGRPGGYWTENLARTATDENVIAAWKASPTHNANLLTDVKYMCLVSEDGYYVLEGWRPN